MTSTLAVCPDPTNAAGVPAAELVTAELDELIIGRRLAFPLRDASGRVLVDEGQALTPDGKRALRDQGIGLVRLHPEDAGRLTFRKESDRRSDSLQFGSEVTRQIDEIIDAGLLDVVNEGPAVREQMAVHGAEPYDPLHQDYLEKQQRAGGDMLNAMLRDAVAGRRLDAETVKKLAGNLLRAMADDADCVVSIAVESDHRTIAEHAVRMAVLGMALGVQMGLDGQNVQWIGMAGLVHDLGMIRVPEAIRHATHKLSRAEFLEITKHPMYTLELLDRTPGLSSQVSIAAYQVHERPNGTGYPRGARGRPHPSLRPHPARGRRVLRLDGPAAVPAGPDAVCRHGMSARAGSSGDGGRRRDADAAERPEPVSGGQLRAAVRRQPGPRAAEQPRDLLGAGGPAWCRRPTAGLFRRTPPMRSSI